MADPKHVTIVKKGVETWNNWKRENSKVKPDLSGANLSQTNPTSADLGEADLIRTDLTRADLTDVNASKCDGYLTRTRLNRSLISDFL